MRVAFALLLFANLAWYGWTHWIAPSRGPPATAAAAEGTGLQLAREAAPTQAGSAVLQPRDNCLSLGPFTDLTDAARASTLCARTNSSPASARVRAWCGRASG